MKTARIHAARFVLLAASVAFAAPARAQGAPNDADALKLAHDAITIDYLGTNFPAAEKKLKQALSLCPGKACSPRVVAQLHRDLGVVYVAGLHRKQQGIAEFVDALKADPTLPLDLDLLTPEIEAAFGAAAQSLGIRAAAPSRPVEETTAPAEPAAPAVPVATPETPPPPPPATIKQSAAPRAEQTVDTPVPVFFRPDPTLSISKADVRYRPHGASEWKVLDMVKMKDGWGVEIPCLDVGTTGDLDYVIRGYDADGRMVMTAGTEQAPSKVAIVNELTGEPPHLPGQSPPAKCSAANECPPDFPGCGGDTGAREQTGPTPRRDFEKNWVSLAFQQDAMLLGSAEDVCIGDTDYSCYYRGSEAYDLTPLEGRGGEVQGGMSIATMRLLAGYDRVLGENVTVGGRVGYAFRSGPTTPDGDSFLPLHLEARGAYFFGSTPFGTDGLRPFVELSAGLAQVDGKVVVKVFDNQQRYQANELTTLNAWRRAGSGFAALGGGAAFGLAPHHALTAELRVMQMFGNPATVLSADIGYAYGL